MNGGHGDMKGIDSSLDRYLKYVGNQRCHVFNFWIGFENRNVL